MDDYFQNISSQHVEPIQRIKKTARIKKVERDDEFRKILSKELYKQNEKDRNENPKYC